MNLLATLIINDIFDTLKCQIITPLENIEPTSVSKPLKLEYLLNDINKPSILEIDQNIFHPLF